MISVLYIYSLVLSSVLISFVPGLRPGIGNRSWVDGVSIMGVKRAPGTTVPHPGYSIWTQLWQTVLNCSKVSFDFKRGWLLLVSLTVSTSFVNRFSMFVDCVLRVKDHSELFVLVSWSIIILFICTLATIHCHHTIILPNTESNPWWHPLRCWIPPFHLHFNCRAEPYWEMISH